jgi:L-gulonolactone oxidase
MNSFTRRLDYTSWGRVVRAEHAVAKPRFPDQLADCLANGGQHASTLAIGLRRSYGDSALNSRERLIDMTRLDRLIAFDAEAGLLRADAGLSIDALLQVIVPKGWFLSTTPGTRFVTLGGAVANDVHGKNHHRSGSLGCSVRSIGLMRSDAPPQRLKPGEPLFQATLGGLGLTGIITDVELSLARIGSAYLEVERVPFRDIGEFFRVAGESTERFEHTVAWIDCANAGETLGRGIFQRANWCADGELTSHRRRTGPALPIDLPGRVLNRLTVRLFNKLYYRLQQRGPRRQRLHYAPVFYPLDSLRDWNRIYGRAGFYQYQCVVPSNVQEAAIRDLVAIIARSGAASFLAVLKTFAARHSGGLVSFPMEGATLALDFPNRGAATLELLAKLDTVVSAAGGRLYPAKDGRMPAAMFQAGYPEWTRLRALKDPALSSDFWRRVCQ